MSAPALAAVEDEDQNPKVVPTLPQGKITCRQLYVDISQHKGANCPNEKYRPISPVSPSSPMLSDATVLSNSTRTTAADPDLVSPFEAMHFFTGISRTPPALLQRSDLAERPFVILTTGRHSVIPEKKVHGLIHKILDNQLWKETIAPEIVQLLKDESRGIRISTMVPVRFSTCDRDGKDVFDDHAVLWISVYPGTTKEMACHDANADILAILANISERPLYLFDAKK